MFHWRLGLWSVLGCVVLHGCTPKQGPVTAPVESEAKPAQSAARGTEAEPAVLQEPVAFWKDGKAQGEVDAVTADEDGHLLLYLGEDWTPYILTEGSGDEVPKPS
ncbi:MAG: hypothetical protein WBN10_17270 [Polyangiales bacterium]